MTRIEIPNSSSRRSSARSGLRILTLLIVVAVVGVALWTWLTISWAYSDGERAGVLQKFSRKGWLCKTQEGEIALYLVAGISPQIWQFSVRDPVVAAELDRVVGHHVQLHYTEHPGVPSSCFADTRYFVDHVTTDEPGSPSAPIPMTPTPNGVKPAAALPAPSAATPSTATP